MAILKCKMCGGDMSVSSDKTFGTCEYCGSTMTLPKIEDEQRADAFNRGNHFRRIGEFDKALSVYERIVEEDPNDAEAHWCCALCRFGIEWVEDPETMEYLPTCHRASFDIFTNDVDYLAAIEHSDGITQKQYKRDAAKISEVQKGILATSRNEKPFDVFICYKESDENGNRTVDSTLAQDIYYQLTDQGLRVFFARITLEDKAGSEYEPYIFAALNSAKVMVAVGTKPENFNAVWVKNEWSRFLSVVKRDRSKVLLPCYKDMDPYDLPEQLSVLQSYDMSKIGFIQDLIRGITKIIKPDEPKKAANETVVVNNTNVEPLIKRAFMSLEDSEWDKADEFCEQALNIDPENARVYLAKLMAELHVKTQDALADCKQPFSDRKNYNRAVRFANDTLKSELNGYLDAVNARINEELFSSKYNEAKALMKNAETKSQYLEAAEVFKSMADYKDSNKLYDTCVSKVADFENASKYSRAKKLINCATTEAEIDVALEILSDIPDYLDSADLIAGAKSKWRKDFEEYSVLAAEFEYAVKVSRSTSKDKNYESDILAINTKISELKAFLIELPEHIDQLKNTESEIAAKKQEINSLNQKRNTLGIFAGKQKKEIDARIEDLQSEVDSLNLTIQTKKNNTKGYNSVDALAAEISALENKASALQAEYQSELTATSGKTSLNEIIINLLTDDVFRFVVKNAALVNALLDNSYAMDAIAANDKLLAVLYSADLTQSTIEKLRKAKQEKISVFAKRYKSIKYKSRISAGDNYILGINKDGTVVAVGENDDGQCNVSDWRDVTAVAASTWYSLGLKKDGTVNICGDTEMADVNVSDWQEVIDIAAADSHTVGLINDGTVAISGDDYVFACSKWKNITAIAVGNYHIVGVKNDGSVIAVGGNSSGQCDVGKWKDIIDVSCGTWHTVALKKDGTVVATGNNTEGQCDVDDWSDIIKIAAYSNYTVGLKSDGTVVAVGDNEYGQCDVEDWTDIVAVSVCDNRTVGLRSDGRVFAVGNNEDGQCNVEEWREIKYISATSNYTFGIGKNGDIVMAGEIDDDLCEEISKCKNVISVSYSQCALYGITNGGKVLLAGFNHPDKNAIKKWSNVTAILTADMGDSVIGLTNSGSVLVAGSCKKFDVDGWKDIVEVAASDGRTLGLMSDGTVLAVGNNTEDQCNVEKWSDIVSVAAGDENTVGLKSDGTVIVAGKDSDNDFYKDLTDIVAVSAGSGHTIAVLKSDGTVLVTNPDIKVNSWKDVVAISCGNYYVIGLTSNGEILFSRDKDIEEFNLKKYGEVKLA